MKKAKFVIAPDSFKESLNAFEAAKAIKEGIEKVFKDSKFELIPMADGRRNFRGYNIFTKG